MSSPPVRSRDPEFEKRTREECRELKYAAVFAQLDKLEPDEIIKFLDRVNDAEKSLLLLYYAHDFRARRLLKFCIGATATVGGVVAGPIVGPVAIIATVLGAGSLLDDAFEFAAMTETARSDRELATALTGFAAKLREEQRRRRP